MINRKKINGVDYDRLYPLDTEPQFNNGVKVSLWIDCLKHCVMEVDITLQEGWYDELVITNVVLDQIKKEVDEELLNAVIDGPKSHATINAIVQRYLMSFLL